MSHRLLPASQDAERGLLSAFLLDPNEVSALCIEKRLTPEQFHLPAHKMIYSTLLSMSEETKPIDIITLTQALTDNGLIDDVGGAGYVTELFTFLPTAANAGQYLDIIQEKYIARELIRVSHRINSEAYEEGADPRELLEKAEKHLCEIRCNGATDKRTKNTKSLVLGALNTIQELYDRKGAIGGLSTGLPELDKLTDGLHPQEFIIISARPSHGKTAFAMNIAEHLAVDMKIPVAVFSLEMSEEQLMQRLVCSRARVNLQRVRDGLMTERDYPNLQTAADKIAPAPLYLEGGSGVTIQELRSRARRLKAQYGIQLLVVDSISVLRGTKKDQKRVEEVAEISQGLKDLAKELGIPVMAIAHLGRAADKSERPRLSDLRECGNLEQDADTILMPIRDELLAEDEETARSLSGRASIWVAKSRIGETGVSVPATFVKEFARFMPGATAVEPDESVPAPAKKKPYRRSAASMLFR